MSVTPDERTDRLPQPMRPHGLAGRLFAVVMERLNATPW